MSAGAGKNDFSENLTVTPYNLVTPCQLRDAIFRMLAAQTQDGNDKINSRSRLDQTVEKAKSITAYLRRSFCFYEPFSQIEQPFFIDLAPTVKHR